jgi:hypothetical protein
MARRSLLSPERREAIERDLADGLLLAVVAERAGVSERSLHRWLAEGRIVRQSVEPSKTGSPEIKGTAVEPDLQERLAAAEPALVSVVLAAAKRGSWQAALALLERTFPERWARPTRARLVEEPPLRHDPRASSRGSTSSRSAASRAPAAAGARLRPMTTRRELRRALARRGRHAATIRAEPPAPARWLAPEADEEEQPEEPGQPTAPLVTQGARSEEPPPRRDPRRWLRPA